MRRLNRHYRDRMNRWGDMRSCDKVDGLSYPKMTAEARLLCSPGRSGKLTYSPDYWPDLEALETEMELNNIDPRQKNIMWWYFSRGAGLDLIAEALSETIWRAGKSLSDAHEAAAKALKMRCYE